LLPLEWLYVRDRRKAHFDLQAVFTKASAISGYLYLFWLQKKREQETALGQVTVNVAGAHICRS
jgi:hypothetical protein